MPFMFSSFAGCHSGSIHCSFDREHQAVSSQRSANANGTTFPCRAAAPRSMPRALCPAIHNSVKNRRLSSIFDSCWRNEESNFRLRQFGKVVPFCELLGWRVDINNRNSLDNSGSKETMQKVLVLGVKNFKNLNLCFSSDLGAN